MTNDDLLQQIDKLIQKRINEAVDPIHERFDAQREHINTVKTELSEKISQQSHEVADILAKAVMPDIDRHEVEIKELQKAVGLRPKH